MRRMLRIINTIPYPEPGRQHSSLSCPRNVSRPVVRAGFYFPTFPRNGIESATAQSGCRVHAISVGGTY